MSFSSFLLSFSFSNCLFLCHSPPWKRIFESFSSCESLFSKGGSFKRITKCMNCYSITEAFSSPLLQFENQRESIEENIAEVFSKEVTNHNRICRSCATGKMIVTPFTPSSEDTWFCTIDVSFMPHYPEELFGIKRVLKFGEKEFALAAFIVHSEEEGDFLSSQK